MRVALVFLVVCVLSCAHALCAAAGDPPVAIEGKLLVSGWDDVDNYAYYMEGSSDSTTPLPSQFSVADMSPLGDQVAYQDGVWDWNEPWNIRQDIWRAKTDGSEATNLTELAGVAGVNCYPQWSPDGSKIAFHHADSVPGLLPCEAGFHAWVMDADGTDAHRVTTPGSSITWRPDWSPNGYRIICTRWSDWATITLDIDGTDVEVVPNVAGEQDWSPDGSKIAWSTHWPDVVEDEPGYWIYLGVTNADGTDPQYLTGQFVTQSDLEYHVDLYGIQGVGGGSAELEVLNWLGPRFPQWSPSGDRLACIAAMPFQADGSEYKFQDEVWVYDLAADDLTKITDDLGHDNWLGWNGDNTSPEDPEVTVDNTTVTFSDVTDDGLTTILRDDDPPAVPSGYQFCGEYYDVSTTATVVGPITICMTYHDEDVPGGNEEALCLLHYDEAIPGYEDITTSRDPVTNIVCGQVDSLSVFGLAEIELPVFGGFRQPINPDGSSVWKAGRTIPVKFKLYDPLGNLMADATCRLGTWQVSSEIVGSVPETVEATYEDVGDTFRYDPDGEQYIHNLRTKEMATGTWMLRVTADGWPEFEATVLIGLR